MRFKAATVNCPAPPVGRNAMCPCGSLRKFKRCCLAKAGKDIMSVLVPNVPTHDVTPVNWPHVPTAGPDRHIVA